MIFLPHTNTVILLEPYCGTITEPGLPVLFTGKESTVLKPLPAVDVLSYFIASEKENLRTERKQNYVPKNEKENKIL